MSDNVKNVDGKLLVTPFNKKDCSKNQPNKKHSKHSDLTIENLVPFHDHPFKLYEGQRFTDMVESTRTNGVLMPIIVRPTAEDKIYEILSGHNRVEAAKEAGLEFVPGIIREGLTDEEAMLIVTETKRLNCSHITMSLSPMTMMKYRNLSSRIIIF
jgi:ParB family chromosome partitioning protein